MFLLFFTVMFSLFALMQYRLYRLYRTWLRRAFDQSHQDLWLKAARFSLLLLNIHFVARFVLSEIGFYENAISQVLIVYPGGFFFATIVFSFLLVSLRDIPILLIRGGRQIYHRVRHRPGHAGPVPATDESRRRFLKLSGMSTAAFVSSVPILASVATARDYQIHRIPLRFENLPPGLEGLKIAQVSDIHAGLYMTEHDMREIFELTNSLDADIIMVTGDFVDSADSQIEPLFNALETLKENSGIFGCLGNHDHFATAEKVSAAAQQRQIVMLNNSHQTLNLNGEKLSIIGIDDAGRGSMNFARFDQALHGLTPESFKIMLTHRPDVWDECRERGMDLTLAGHTHGGQVGFQLGPLNLNPVYLIHKYAMGLYGEGGRHLYVNVGVGMVGVPIRMVKPEISLFELRSSR